MSLGVKAHSLAELRPLRRALQEAAAQQAAQAQAQREAQQRAQRERHLFAHTVGAVQPLKSSAAHNRHLPPPSAPEPLPLQRLQDEQRVLHEAMSDEFDVSTLLDVDDQLSFRRPGIGQDVTRKLRAGCWSIQRQLDLHGLRRDLPPVLDVSVPASIGLRSTARCAVHRTRVPLTRVGNPPRTCLEQTVVDLVDDAATESGVLDVLIRAIQLGMSVPRFLGHLASHANDIEVPLGFLRGLVVELNLAVVIVTHDLGVARLLADRLLVMKQGQVVESGLTDRVLDDPHHPYTQLLVSSVLQN